MPITSRAPARSRGAGSVRAWRYMPHHQAHAQGNQQQVVQIAQDGDEIGHQIDGAERIGGHQHGQQACAQGHTAIAPHVIQRQRLPAQTTDVRSASPWIAGVPPALAWTADLSSASEPAHRHADIHVKAP